MLSSQQYYIWKKFLHLTLQQRLMQSITFGKLATHWKAKGISLTRSLFKYLTTYDIEVKTCIQKIQPSIHHFLNMSGNVKHLQIECATWHHIIKINIQLFKINIQFYIWGHHKCACLLKKIWVPVCPLFQHPSTCIQKSWDKSAMEKPHHVDMIQLLPWD